MAEISWSKDALLDLREIAEFISRDSITYASNVVENIISKSEVLKKFPRIGRVIPELNDQSFPELIIGNYRLMYWIRSDENISIVAIHHVARNFPSSWFE